MAGSRLSDAGTVKGPCCICSRSSLHAPSSKHDCHACISPLFELPSAPAGKWKGVTVAVKIVEHNEETESSLNQLRESLLSSSIVHPNVVSILSCTTLKTWRMERAGPFNDMECCRGVDCASFVWWAAGISVMS